VIAHAKVKIPSLVSLFCGIGSLLAALYFVFILKCGLAGFAFATMVGVGVRYMIFDPYYACRVAGIEYRPFYFRSFLMPLFINCLFGAFMGYLKFHVNIGIPYVFIVSAAAFPIYCLVAYKLVLNDHERRLLKEAVVKLRDVLSRGKRAGAVSGGA